MNPALPLCLVLLFLSQSFTSASSLLRRPIPHCFPASTSPSPPRRVPAVFAECLRIINLIPSVALDPTIPVKWGAGTSSHADFALPARWKGLPFPPSPLPILIQIAKHQALTPIPGHWDKGSINKCVVELNLKEGEKGSDRSNLEDIKEAAKAVAVQCVIRPPHLGGWVQVGW